MSLHTLSFKGFSFTSAPQGSQYVTVRYGPKDEEFYNVLLSDMRTYYNQPLEQRLQALENGEAGAVRPSIWPTQRTLALTGVLGGSVAFDGSQNFTLNATMADGALTIAKTTGLQAALDAKVGIDGTVASADKLTTARRVTLTGPVTGTFLFDGSSHISFATTVTDGGLTIGKTAGLQAALNNKASIAGQDYTGEHRYRGPVELWDSSLVLRNTAGVAQGALAWNSTADAIALRRFAADGGALEGELALHADRAEFNGNTLYHTGNLSPSSLNYLTVVPVVYTSGAGINCNNLQVGSKALVHNSNVNTPGTAASFWYIETMQLGDATGALIQRAHGLNNSEFWTRVYDGGWKAWRRFWNAENFNPTTKLDATAAAISAQRLTIARTIALTGAVSGSATWDGSENLTLSTTLAAGSIGIGQISGLQSALNDKLNVGQFGVGSANTDFAWNAEIRQSQFASGMTGGPESGKSYMGLHSVLAHSNYYAMNLVARDNKLWFQTVEAGTAQAWREVYHSGNFNPLSYAPSTRQINAGNGLTGGGPLTGDMTLSLGTPGTVSGTSTNSVGSGTHSHALSTNLKAWDAISPSSKLDVGASVAQAEKLANARVVSLTGVVTAVGSFDGSANLNLDTTIADAALSIAKVNGLQAQLDLFALKNNPVFTGTTTLKGDLLPDLDNVRSLGSETLMWRDVYIGPGSLYINGQKVLEENSGTIRMTADPGQNISVQTLGTGDIELAPQGTGIIQLKGPVSFTGGQKIRTSNGSAFLFDDNLSFTASAGIEGDLRIDGHTAWHAGNLDPTKKLDVTATAAAAQKLSTPRRINGVAFDGTEDIQLPLVQDRTHTHDQSVPLETWNVTHGLNKYPAVSIVDSAGSLIIGSIKYLDNNTVRIELAYAMAGQAFFN